MIRKKISFFFLSLALLVSSSLAAAPDCLDQFQNDVVTADEILVADVAACGDGLIGIACTYVAGLNHELRIKIAATEYDNCCLRGGSGCP